MEELKKIIKKLREINDEYLNYTVKDIKYILMMFAGMLIFCISGIKYRQFMGLVMGLLSIAVSLYLFIREGDNDAQQKYEQEKDQDPDL